MVGLVEMEVRSYVAEPDRGPRNWDGKEAEKAAVYRNRRRVQGTRGKRLQRQRGERIERNFAHQFDTGGLDRLYVRGLENVHKKFLIQAAACNLALLLRSRYGSGKPRAAHDRVAEAILMILASLRAVEDSSRRSRGASTHSTLFVANQKATAWIYSHSQIGQFRHGLLDVIVFAAMGKRKKEKRGRVLDRQPVYRCISW
jgi:hypothetical protein